MTGFHKVLETFCVMFFAFFMMLNDAKGQAPSHDPTHIVKDGGRYWIYTTGNGIWNMSSSDVEFTNWQAEDPVFPIGTYPAWIDEYVSGFGGHFWAPEVFFMNEKWHIYYSCSNFGSTRSAIGLVTSPTLSDPTWEDQGLVLHSNDTLTSYLGVRVNAIDAALMKDKDDRIWLLYGSWWDGLVITEIDSTTGKPFDPLNVYRAANNTSEAGYLLSHGDYYYVFFTRGNCCRGVNSSYRILMGRSTSPTGPFYDKDGIITHQGGGSLFMHSDGRHVGPGHFGYGHGKLTYHYYDAFNNGAARLGVADMEWDDDGWPIAIYEREGGIEDGTYVLVNSNSNKVLSLNEGATANGTNVIQYGYTNEEIQHWDFTHIGQGFYKITPHLAPDKVLEVANCGKHNGANVRIWNYTGSDCQHWYAGRMSLESEFHIVASHSDQALEIEYAYTYDGANAKQWPYTGHKTQLWQVKDPSEVTALENPVMTGLSGIKIFPNPSSNGNFTIQFSGTNLDNGIIYLEIYKTDGTAVHSREYAGADNIRFSEKLDKGLYLVRIIYRDKVINQKLTVN